MLHFLFLLADVYTTTTTMLYVSIDTTGLQAERRKEAVGTEGLSHIDYLEFHLPAARNYDGLLCLHSDALVHMLHLALANPC